MAKLKLTFPEFRHAPSVICASGSLRSVAQLDDGTTAFLTSGQERVQELLVEAQARGGGSLRSENHLCKPDGEPTEASIRHGSEFLRSAPFRRIVAVGGGSVLDWARLAWADSAGALDVGTGTVTDRLAKVVRPALWLVPTTCATGAEAADVAVYCAASGAKRAVVTPAFIADKVILDGRFIDGMAPPPLAAFLCDALSHALEASLSPVPVALGKEAALSALHGIIAAYRQPPSSSRNDRFMEAAFLGGVAAANCSVGIVHAFAHSVGVDGLSHGLANACALEVGLDFNAATMQMHGLLERVHAGDAAALAARIAPITRGALSNVQAHPVAQRLQDPGYRRQIATRMAEDMAIRSNPRRASAAELEDFVCSVAERVALR